MFQEEWHCWLYSVIMWYHEWFFRWDRIYIYICWNSQRGYSGNSSAVFLLIGGRHCQRLFFYSVERPLTISVKKISMLDFNQKSLPTITKTDGHSLPFFFLLLLTHFLLFFFVFFYPSHWVGEVGIRCTGKHGICVFRSTFVALQPTERREITDLLPGNCLKMAMRPATARGGARGQSPQRDPATWNKIWFALVGDGKLPKREVLNRLFCGVNGWGWESKLIRRPFWGRTNQIIYMLSYDFGRKFVLFRKVPGKVFTIRVFGRKPSNRYPGIFPQDSLPKELMGRLKELETAQKNEVLPNGNDGMGIGKTGGLKPGERFFLLVGKLRVSRICKIPEKIMMESCSWNYQLLFTPISGKVLGITW